MQCSLLLPLCVRVCVWFLFCNVVLSFLSSFAIISLQEVAAGCFTLCLAVVWLSVFCVSSPRCRGLVCVIVAFPGSTHLFLAVDVVPCADPESFFRGGPFFLS